MIHYVPQKQERGQITSDNETVLFPMASCLTMALRLNDPLLVKNLLIVRALAYIRYFHHRVLKRHLDLKKAKNYYAEFSLSTMLLDRSIIKNIMQYDVRYLCIIINFEFIFYSKCYINCCGKLRRVISLFQHNYTQFCIKYHKTD